MIRAKIAAWLLRSMGAQVEWRCKRVKPTKIFGSIPHINRDGTTVERGENLSRILRKYKSIRVADTDTITVQLVANVKQRHGTVESGTTNGGSENA